MTSSHQIYQKSSPTKGGGQADIGAEFRQTTTYVQFSVEKCFRGVGTLSFAEPLENITKRWYTIDPAPVDSWQYPRERSIPYTPVTLGTPLRLEGNKSQTPLAAEKVHANRIRAFSAARLHRFR